jgi:hypothetical protein
VIGESSTSGWSEVVREPRLVGYPFISMRSLIEAGTPSTSPIGSPRRQRASDWRASSSAASWQTMMKALSAAPCRSIRSSAARVASTGDKAPER